MGIVFTRITTKTARMKYIPTHVCIYIFVFHCGWTSVRVTPMMCLTSFQAEAVASIGSYSGMTV